MQRAPLLLQWWGDGSRDALSMLGASRHGRKMRASTKIEARGNQRGRLKDCRTSPGSDGSFGIPHKSGSEVSLRIAGTITQFYQVKRMISGLRALFALTNSQTLNW